METQRQRQTRRQGGEGRQPALVSLRLQSNFSTDGISRRAKKLENHESGGRRTVRSMGKRSRRNGWLPHYAVVVWWNITTVDLCNNVHWRGATLVVIQVNASDKAAVGEIEDLHEPLLGENNVWILGWSTDKPGTEAPSFDTKHALQLVTDLPSRKQETVFSSCIF